MMKHTAGIPREVLDHVVGALPRHTRHRVVSVNRVLATVRGECPAHKLPESDAAFAQSIAETASSLGLVPVYDPTLRIEEAVPSQRRPVARRRRG